MKNAIAQTFSAAMVLAAMAAQFPGAASHGRLYQAVCSRQFDYGSICKSRRNNQRNKAQKRRQ